MSFEFLDEMFLTLHIEFSRGSGTSDAQIADSGLPMSDGSAADSKPIVSDAVSVTTFASHGKSEPQSSDMGGFRISESGGRS